MLTDGKISKIKKQYHNLSYWYLYLLFRILLSKDISWFSLQIHRCVHISMNGTLLLPLFIKLQSIRWLCTYVHLPSGLHVNKQISCGSNYTLKETFSSISTLEAHNTSSRVIILCIRLLYHLAKNFKTCKKIICQPFLERQEICHPKIKTIYYTIDQGKILIILMVLSYITFNALT